MLFSKIQYQYPCLVQQLQPWAMGYVLCLCQEPEGYKSVILSSLKRDRLHSPLTLVEECLKCVTLRGIMLYGTDYHLFRWITQRKVFGKPLHSQAVIRAKIAGMISRAEGRYHLWPLLFYSNSLQNTRRPKLAGEYYLSDVQHGNYHLRIIASFIAWCSPQSYKQQAGKLAGYVQVLNIGSCCWWTNLIRQIALLKSYSTGCGQDTARDAVQVFGGRGITQTGMGKYIEHVCYTGTCFFHLCYTELHGLQYHRTIPFDALLGGAEDVLADLGVRQALRGMPRDTRL